ncbi:RNA polymerase sigma factor [Leeuwenhoekiella sp. MAR_2009_132]|uniref:RNA polymerase sigma factor n=1 Tax=Leeuwenhoekiella sp. MAR_2009_132 TaxID=1392489 RepID=UPI00048DDD64|nr:sigma-70 family RNA polymerase sigma factor [Leeuwenhoekiella sp. MAR_2009_132]
MNTSAGEIKSVFQNDYKNLCVFAYGYVLDKDNAKDIVQEVFVKLLELDHLNHINNLPAYIKTSVYNACLKSIRQNSTTKILTQAEHRIPSENLTQENQIIQEEESRSILKELDLLPKECRRAFELCVIHGYKYTDAAESLHISKNTLKTHIKKAYRILRESMKYAQVLWAFIGY